MATPTPEDVYSKLKTITAYNSQLATAFHAFVLNASRIPPGFEGTINIFDATIVTLNQVLSLLETETEDGSRGRRCFSDEGLKYAELLGIECARCLIKVEPLVKDAGLSDKERKAKRRQERKLKVEEVDIDFDDLILDDEIFLEEVENARWEVIMDEIEACTDRLYDIQLHLLLVYQVVTVGSLSKDLSLGIMDVKSIVAFHDRAIRTAELLGIKPPRGRSRTQRSGFGDSDGDSGSVESESESDALNISTVNIMPKKRGMRGGGPPAPPAPSAPPSNRLSPPSPTTGNVATSTTSATATENGNPPSYSESHTSSDTSSSTSSTTTSTLLGTVSEVSSSSVTSSTTTTTSATSDSSASSSVSSYPDEKKLEPEEELEGVTETKETKEVSEATVITNVTSQINLSNFQNRGFGFKLKSYFRSRQKVGEEMKRVMEDTESHLLAYIINCHNYTPIPHSAFHTLESTHIRTILSQLNNKSWYKTFSSLTIEEHATLSRLRHSGSQTQELELVALKIVRKNRLHTLANLLRNTFRMPSFSEPCSTRAILAIVREQLVDGKPPVPSPPTIMPEVPRLRPPPSVNSSLPMPTRISDLSVPLPPSLPIGQYFPSSIPPPRPSPPPPPSNPANYGPPPPAPAPGQINPHVLPPFPATADRDCLIALTTYTTFTLRPYSPSSNPNSTPWNKISISNHTPDLPSLITHLTRNQNQNQDIVQTLLSLTTPQAQQVERVMDELKCGEQDGRFEWCWIEISLFDKERKLILCEGGRCGEAEMIYAVAKRQPKSSCRMYELYWSLLRGPMPAQQCGVSEPLEIKIGRKGRKGDSRRERSLSSISSRSSSSSSGSGSEDSDGSSVGVVRRRLRINKNRKLRRERMGNGSDSGSEGEEEKDPVRIKIKLRRGDDVVRKLLDIWTPRPKGKGKMV